MRADCAICDNDPIQATLVKRWRWICYRRFGLIDDQSNSLEVGLGC